MGMIPLLNEGLNSVLLCSAGLKGTGNGRNYMNFQVQLAGSVDSTESQEILVRGGICTDKSWKEASLR